MSPGSRSKSKGKAGKEPPKGSSKSSSHVNTIGGTPASGYNPLSGTFHTFEAAPVPSPSTLHVNGRFRNIDDTDDHNGISSGNGIEYDSVSNTGSWSGESEDHKEKASQPPPRQESVPGADNDKREKIRQKNERKHQRQKEKRAQELHERCSGFLMSRKLEALGQQLVAMGFSQERATMALILNEGRVEQSVAWLFEGGEDDKREHNLDSGGDLKIDISEELGRITDLEIKYRASRQEVERAIVSCEGDLEKAEETLKAQKEEPPATPPKPEETGDPPTVANGKQPVAVSHNVTRIQAAKAAPSTIIQQKRDEKDFNYTKVSATVGSSSDLGTRTTVQVLKKIPPKTDWAKPQQTAVPAADKRWPSTGPPPSASFSLASPMQASSTPPVTTEARYIPLGNELKNLQLGSVKEPVVVMQRPQSMNSKQVAPSVSLSSSPPGWYPPNRGETVRPNGFVPPVTVSRSLSPGPNGLISSNSFYNPLQYQSQHQFLPNSSSVDLQGSVSRGNGFRSRGGATPGLAAASSLGLFSGLGANGPSGSSSSVDWNTGSTVMQFDYTNIDWSLDCGSLSSRPNGLWTGANYSIQNSVRDSSLSYGLGVRSAANRSIVSNGVRAPVPGGLQEGVVPTEQAAGGSREWTSPFEERDIFSLPRQFVSSPSL